MEYIDCMDQEIKVGDTIVYAVRHGSFAKMKKGTVAALTKSTDNWPTLRLHTEGSERLVSFYTLRNCAVIKSDSERI